MNDVVDISIPEPKKGSLVIQGTTYEVSLLFNINDSLRLEEADLEQDDDYLLFVKDTICEHIISDVVIDTNWVTEENCINYIELFLNANPEARDIYNSCDEVLHPCMRFVLVQKELLNKMVENIKPALLEFSEIIHKMSEDYMKIIKPLVEGIQSFVSQFQEIYEPIINSFSEQVRSFIDAFSHISIPQLSEEDKQRIIDRYMRWGNYGWTGTDFLEQELLDFRIRDSYNIVIK